MGLVRWLRKVWTRTEMDEVAIATRIGDARQVHLQAAQGMRSSQDSVVQQTRDIGARNASAAMGVLRARIGTPAEEPAHTGEDLERDMDEHIANVKRWNEEDRAGRGQ